MEDNRSSERWGEGKGRVEMKTKLMKLSKKSVRNLGLLTCRLRGLH